MNAVRMGEPEKAIRAILMNKRTNTYLVNGHNYQNRTPPLLSARQRRIVGDRGADVRRLGRLRRRNPGFPKDGTWDVRWEAINPMP